MNIVENLLEKVLLSGRKNKSMSKKKVVYLFGAGATQAVLKSNNPLDGLLIKDIQEQIKKKYTSKDLDGKIWNELISINSDIEHLITVLETQHKNTASEKIRKYYRESIIEIAEPISKSLSEKNLYSVLIDYYNISKLDEELLCFITLNYEDILERIIKSCFNLEIDYALHSNKKKSKTDAIKVLKLHGSFNWRNTRPVSIIKMTTKNSYNSLWIPPGVEKRKDNYPFNILWGQATEYLMQCDILRVVGCSLSRNDWGLIPILYTIQKFNDSKMNTEIEIIDYPSTALNIIENYKYMKFCSITDIPEFLEFHKKKLPAASDSELIKEIKAKFSDKDKSNPFYEWLDAKIDFLIDKKVDIKTPKNIVYNFYHKI
ncbi:MAG TPA: hypothetical protein VIL99_14230 [Ignavibacteria bacterium]